MHNVKLTPGSLVKARCDFWCGRKRIKQEQLILILAINRYEDPSTPKPVCLVSMLISDHTPCVVSRLFETKVRTTEMLSLNESFKDIDD